MKKALSIGKKAADFLGIWIPNLTFGIIFLTFMITIISRYILKTPVAWSYEISILAYMWTMFFGVGKAMEADEHVVFGLVYDSAGPKTKIAMKILYNVILVALLCLVFFPSVRSLLSKKMVTGVLKLPFTIVFSPMIYMFAEIIIRSVLEIRKNILHLLDIRRNGPSGTEEKAQ